MIYITGNSKNLIYVSVSPHKTLPNPTYLMTLTHSQTNEKYNFIPNDVTSISGSPYNQRYDVFEFIIQSGGTENLTGGTSPTVVNINEIGEFKYAIREQFSPTNLNPQFSMETLETGLAFLYKDEHDIYYQRPIGDVVYDPQKT